MDEDPVLAGSVLELPGEGFLGRREGEVVRVFIGDEQTLLAVQDNSLTPGEEVEKSSRLVGPDGRRRTSPPRRPALPASKWLAHSNPPIPVP
jgi:hypothetical protein